MAQTIRLRRGIESALPTTGLVIGEPLYTTDHYNVYVADSTTTHKPLTPNISDLVTITGVNVVTADDLLMIHDASESGHREKKITVAELKTSLNIPAASSDEQVAATSGGTAGYLEDVVVGETGVISIGSINAGEDLEWTIDVGGIDTAKLANDAVTTAKIAGGAVGTTELGSNAVTTVKITDANITTAKVADNAITSAKVADGLLDLDATVFSGTGIDTELTVSTIDGGSF